MGLAMVFALGRAHGQVSSEFFLTAGSSMPSPSHAICDGTGNFYFGGNGNSGTIVIKTDSVGGMLWSKWLPFGGPMQGPGLAVLNGDLILATGGPHFSSSSDALVRRISSGGALLWEQRIDVNALSNGLHSAVVVNDTIILAGFARVDSLGLNHAMVRMSGDGSLISAVTLGGPHDELSRYASPTSNGEVLLVGESRVAGTNTTDITLVRIDSDDNELWSLRIDLGGSEAAWCAHVDAATGDCYVGGSHSAYGFSGVYYRGFIMKFSSAGVHQWTRLLHETHGFKGICAAGPGMFAAGAGTTSGFNGHGGRDAIVIHFNADGLLIGDRVYGTDANESVASFERTTQDGYLMTGASTPWRIYGVRTSSDALESVCSGFQVPVAWQSVVPSIESVVCTKSAGFVLSDSPTPPAFWTVDREFMCCPFPVSAVFNANPTENPQVWEFHSTSSGNGMLQWSFGGSESDITHVFDSMGLHEVCLTISSPCDTATTCLDLLVSSTSYADGSPNGSRIYPQPADAGVWVSASDPLLAVHMFATDGSIKRLIGQTGSKEVWIPLADIPIGFYWLGLHTANGVETCRLVVQR
jgi:hypothetical protein